MSFIRGLLIALALSALVSSCTSVKVRPVEDVSEIKHVCVKDGRQACFESQMMDIIHDGLQRHGITSSVYDGKLPIECEYYLTYYCERTWDMASYMHHAELRLYRGKDQIGYAEYHLLGKGGFSLMKWQDTRTKMDPVIDKLLHDSRKKP